MKNKTKLRTVGAAVLLSVLLVGIIGCAEQSTDGRSVDPIVTDQNDQTESKPTASDNSENSAVQSVETGVSEPVSEESSAEAVGINAEAVWGLGKSFNEITEKYGGVTGSYSNNKIYEFENGYGRYVWNIDGGNCKAIGEISARDFISGDLSAVTLENIAEKCGFEVVPLNDTDDPNTMYEGYRQAYYTHPSYENVTFGMLYKESGFDETAKFDVRYNSET